MANSTTNLDTIATNQSNKEVVANALFDASSPSMLWGRHASACSGLTWGYYGGQFGSNAISNGTVTLTASTTNYVYADNSTGAVSVNTTGVPSGKIPLYSIATGSTTVNTYSDLRSYTPTALGASFGTQNANYVFAGPTSGGAATPAFRALVGADIPVFVASGGSHAPGGVPDPGATAGTTRFLREDGTWNVPAGGGGTLSSLSDVSVTEGAGINGYSLVWNNTAGKWEASNIGGGGGGTLAGLTDVSLSTPTNGQVLTYNTTAGKWENATPSGGGGSGTTPSIVQKASNSNSGSSVTVTLGSAPAAGNMLVAMVGGYANNNSAGVLQTFSAADSEWTMIGQYGYNNNEMVSVFVRPVFSGDPTTWTFNSTGSIILAMLYEVTNGGAVSVVGNPYQAAPSSSSGTSNGPGGSAMLANAIAIFAMAQDAAAATATLSTGWTLDLGSSGSGLSFHTLIAGHATIAAAGAFAGPTVNWTSANTSQPVPSATVVIHPKPSGGTTNAISTTSGAGYPTASASPGDMYRATDGWPGARLFAYEGAFTGMPTIVNFGYAAPTATGTLNVTMNRAVTPGNLLVAFGFGDTSNSNLAPVSGWTTILNTNTPTPGQWALSQIAASSSTTVNPFTVSSVGQGNLVMVVEIANAAASSPVVGGTSGTTSGLASRACTLGNLAIVANAGLFEPCKPVSGAIVGGVGSGTGSVPIRGQVFGLPLLASMGGAGVASAPGYGSNSAWAGSMIVEIAAGAASVNLWTTIH